MGISLPHSEGLDRIAKFFKVTTDYILSGGIFDGRISVMAAELSKMNTEDRDKILGKFDLLIKQQYAKPKSRRGDKG